MCHTTVGRCDEMTGASVDLPDLEEKTALHHALETLLAARHAEATTEVEISQPVRFHLHQSIVQEHSVVISWSFLVLVGALPKAEAMVRLLLDRGADPRKGNKVGQRPPSFLSMFHSQIRVVNRQFPLAEHVHCCMNSSDPSPLLPQFYLCQPGFWPLPFDAALDCHGRAPPRAKGEHAWQPKRHICPQPCILILVAEAGTYIQSHAYRQLILSYNHESLIDFKVRAGLNLQKHQELSLVVPPEFVRQEGRTVG